MVQSTRCVGFFIIVDVRRLIFSCSDWWLLRPVPPRGYLTSCCLAVGFDAAVAAAGLPSRPGAMQSLNSHSVDAS